MTPRTPHTRDSSTEPASADAGATRVPRLVVRFAVYMAIGLALATAGIVLFVRQASTEQAEQAVEFHTGFVAEALLRERLAPGDVAGPVNAARAAKLDEIFARDVMVGATLRVRLYAPDGRVTYASDRSLVGTRPAGSRPLAAALRGGTATETGSFPGAGGETLKTLTVYAPVSLGPEGATGAFSLDHDYRPIAAAARNAFLPVVLVLEALLVGLWLILLPVLHRLTQRLRRQMAEVERQARHDPLTGLPNRTLFRERLDEAHASARAGDGAFAVLVLDLDDFRRVNDTLGHESGDLLLKAAAERLRGLAGSDLTVARIGGDEFGVVAPAVRDATSALVLGERIRRELERPVEVLGFSLQLEASIGIALHGEHGDDAETLLRRADVAIQASKAAHAPRLYTPRHDPYSAERLALISDLRRGLEQRELVLFWQPLADLATGDVRRVEALVRWRHPERGLIAPSDFVPLAEHTALARPLTRAVLEAAIAQAAAWHAAGLDLPVAANLFGRDLLDLELADEIGELLARAGLEPARLELEISENTIVTDPERTRVVLKRLRERGLRLAVDDFGSGFTSLSYLKRLPADVLKIDRSFVQRMTADRDDDVIVRSTIDLGHNLGLEIVAEGVETRAIWNRLALLGCDAAQGNFVSRPLPAAELEEWVRDQARRGAARARRRAASAG